MPNIRDNCPVCGKPVTTVKIICQSCSSVIDAPVSALQSASQSNAEADTARFGALAKLNREQLHFVEVFIRARGIIKNVEGMLGISYPTVRSRLDEVVTTMGMVADTDTPVGEVRRGLRDILDSLADGKVTPEQAHELMQNLTDM